MEPTALDLKRLALCEIHKKEKPEGQKTQAYEKI